MSLHNDDTPSSLCVLIHLPASPRIVRTFLPTDFYSIPFFGKRSKRRTTRRAAPSFGIARHKSSARANIFSFFVISSYFLARTNRTEIPIFPISRRAKRKKCIACMNNYRQIFQRLVLEIQGCSVFKDMRT